MKGKRALSHSTDRADKEYQDHTAGDKRPYYMVVYHELYYLICSKPGTGKISHYRIDLMSNVGFAKDENEKYMREHLYMFYDEPRSIILKVHSENYTAVHDHFGDHYTVLGSDGKGYDRIKVTCSANAMAVLVMQYAGMFRVDDEEVKKLVREKMKALEDSLQ